MSNYCLWDQIKHKPHDISFGITKPEMYYYENILGVYYPIRQIPVSSSFTLVVEQAGDFYTAENQGLTFFFDVFMPETRELFTLQISPYDMQDDKTHEGDIIHITGIFKGTDLIAKEIHKL